jgi:mxaC protein
MLVSDGGDRLDPDTRERLAHLTRKLRVSIYWLYLRSANSPGLTAAAGDTGAAAESVPEMLLHGFFQSLQTPYRAYEAGDAQALQRAIDDVSRLERLPIAYDELIARRELAPWGHGIALLAVLLMLSARLLEIRRWV